MATQTTLSLLTLPIDLLAIISTHLSYSDLQALRRTSHILFILLRIPTIERLSQISNHDAREEAKQLAKELCGELPLDGLDEDEMREEVQIKTRGSYGSWAATFRTGPGMLDIGDLCKTAIPG